MTNLYLYLKNVIKKHIATDESVDGVIVSLSIENVSNTSTVGVLMEDVTINFNVWCEDNKTNESKHDERQEEVVCAVSKIVEELKAMGIYQTFSLLDIRQYNDEEYRYCNMRYLFKLREREVK